MPPCRQTSVAPRSQASRARRGDLVEVEIVGPAAQVLAELALGEGAELAAEVADVGVVDVAVDDVADGVAADLARAARRPRAQTASKSSPRACEQRDDVGFVERRAARPRDRGSRSSARRLPARPRARRRVGGGASAPGDQASVAREALARRSARSTGVRSAGVEPALRVARVGRIDRQPLDQHLAGARRSRAASASRCGHGASGLTWSGVTGETPPQSLMPAAISLRQRAGLQIGRRLDVHRRRRRSRRATAMVQRWSSSRGSGASRHARAGLGAEILDDDFLDDGRSARAGRAAPAAPRCARAASRRCRSGCRW